MKNLNYFARVYFRNRVDRNIVLHQGISRVQGGGEWKRRRLLIHLFEEPLVGTSQNTTYIDESDIFRVNRDFVKLRYFPRK